MTEDGRKSVENLNKSQYVESHPSLPLHNRGTNRDQTPDVHDTPTTRTGLLRVGFFSVDWTEAATAKPSWNETELNCCCGYIENLVINSMKQKYAYRAFITILMFFSISSLSYSQNYRITGTIVNGDTKQPIDSAVVYLFGKGYLEYTHWVTDSTGKFLFDGLGTGRYNLHFYHDTYKSGQKMIRITDSSVYFQLYMFHVDSSGVSRVDDIAYEDNYHGGFAVNFYNPDISPEFKSSFNIEYIYSFKKKVTTYDQIGLDLIPIKLVWHNLNRDTTIANEKYKAERYFGYYLSAFVYNRLIINKQRKTGFPGLFLDLGVGYEFPLYFRYMYKIDSDHKTTMSRIHRMNEFVGMARLGFDVISIKATYRFSDIIKNNYPEPPKFKIGIEFNFPNRYI